LGTLAGNQRNEAGRGEQKPRTHPPILRRTLEPVRLTADFRFRGSLGQEKHGHGGFAEYMDVIQWGFPDFRNDVEEIISEGDHAFARLTYRGTHSGEVLGIPPTGRRVEYAGAAVFRFRNDRIAEVWVLGDLHGLLSQLRGSAS
jgi:predicted ester cyclase